MPVPPLADAFSVPLTAKGGWISCSRVVLGTVPNMLLESEIRGAVMLVSDGLKGGAPLS